MTVTGFHRLGVLVFVGTLWFGLGNAFAVNYEDQLQPIPSPYPATAGQTQGAAVQDNAAIATDDAEFCGMPVCSPPGRIWLRGDYLMWWTSGMNLPPLVTSGPTGILEQPGTTILFGGDTVRTDGRSGVRTTIGMWLDACHVWNLEFDYLSLGSRGSSFEQTSTGTPLLARPFFNLFDLTPGDSFGSSHQGAELIANSDPNVGQLSSGTVTVDVGEYFQSAGALVSYNLCSCNSCCDSCGSCGSCGSCDSCDSCDSCGAMGCTNGCVPLLHCCRTDLLVGFRYYGLNDHVNVHETLDVPDDNLTIDVQDHFSARNDFYGSEVGLRTQIYRGRWSFEVLAKVAMGDTRQVANINGQTIIADPRQPPPQTYNGGLLALGPIPGGNPVLNAGTYQRDVFSAIPQVGLEIGYQLGCHWRAYVGYNLLYWGDVWRSGDQIDFNIDPRNVPPPQLGGLPYPAFPARSTAFWAQGVSVGTEIRF